MSLLPAETRLGAIRLRAGDADRLRAFYEQTIGLEVLGDAAGVATLGAGGKPLVEILADPAAPPRPPGSTGLFHLALPAVNAPCSRDDVHTRRELLLH